MKLPKRLIFLVVILLLTINTLNLLTIITITGQSTTTGTVSICFNHPPAITAIPDQRADHNFLFSLNLTAVDSDNDNFNYTDNTSLFQINSTTGKILFTPALAQVNNYTITIYAQDNFTACPATSNKNFNLEIYNLAPNLTSSIPNQTWEENVALTGINLNNYFTDPENDNMSFSYQKGNNITLNITASGNVSIYPQTNFYGLTWIIFLANDSLAATNSNNLTLNITPVTNYCGDNTCNSNETCSSCAQDCGACPSVPPRGGGITIYPDLIEIISEISRKERELPLPPEKTCAEQRECHPWPTSTCPYDQKQTRTCMNTNTFCKITETIEERICICQPQWECTTWYPEKCTGKQPQTRACLDINNCGKDNPYPTQKLCSEQLTQIKPANIFGQALSFTKNISQTISKNQKTIIYASIIILIFISLVLLIRKLYQKNQQKIMPLLKNILCQIKKYKHTPETQEILPIKDRLRLQKLRQQQLERINRLHQKLHLSENKELLLSTRTKTTPQKKNQPQKYEQELEFIATELKKL
ncbi:hypothetical protein HYX11_01050 [Candidatus Woesearchaeota archaeon]|nr:hypothetical protein [Candidatus Woesearchaeota archaeon]